MKKLIILLFMVTTLPYSSFSQVYNIHISNIFQFKHLDVISTDQAIEHGFVKLDTMSITDATYIFDFNNMTVTLVNYNGATAKRKLLDKNLQDGYFETYFIDTPSNLPINVLYSDIDCVLCLRWNETINNIGYTQGWISKVDQ